MSWSGSTESSSELLRVRGFLIYRLEIGDSQLGRAMTSLRDLTADDDGRCPEVGALPLEASRVGRDISWCLAQTDIEVGRQYEASLVGRVVDESSQQVGICSTGDALPLVAIPVGASGARISPASRSDARMSSHHRLNKLSASLQNVSFT